MHGAGSIAARARRLTDTQIPKHQAAAAADHQQHSSHAGLIGSSPAGSAPGPELLSVIGCYGGCMEANKTTQVGNYKVTYSVHTQAGADLGGNVKDNQDAWCIQERLAGQDMAMFGVFDGHGQEGKTVSHAICTNVPKALAQHAACKPATLESALGDAFPEANAALKRLPALDADLSGSTGIVAVLTHNKLVVANLGDSRCVLGKVGVRGGVSAVALSVDHTPMDPREAGRVVAAGGRIASFMCGDEPLGPPRVWLRDVNVPGLCMTRSFGDLVAASVGVIDEPQVITAVLRPEDKYIVLMSDGIFEFLDSQQIMGEVHAAAQAGQPPSEAARKLVRTARKCWQEQEEEIIDDCTAMVIYLQPAVTASAAGALGSLLAGNTSSSSGSGSASAAHHSSPGAAGAARDLATRLGAGLNLKNNVSASSGNNNNNHSGGSSGSSHNSGHTTAAAAAAGPGMPSTASKAAGHALSAAAAAAGGGGGVLGYKRG